MDRLLNSTLNFHFHPRGEISISEKVFPVGEACLCVTVRIVNVCVYCVCNRSGPNGMLLGVCVCVGVCSLCMCVCRRSAVVQGLPESRVAAVLN